MQAITLSSKNQITLPKAILEALSIKSGEKLLIEKKDDAIRIKPLGASIVDQIAGSINISRSQRNVPFEKALQETRKIVVKKLAQK